MTKNHRPALKAGAFGAYLVPSLAKVPDFNHRDRGPSL